MREAEKALAAGEFPVGCVMVQKGEIVAAGSRKNSTGDGGNEIDHAEIVTLRTLLTCQNGADLAGTVVYSTMEPCLMCFSTMILSGIKKIVYGYEDVMGGACGLELSQFPPLYAEMNIEVIGGVRREESLKLFKAFFQRVDHGYWHGSLLETYTLSN